MKVLSRQIQNFLGGLGIKKSLESFVLVKPRSANVLIKSKSNLYYTRGISPKRVTSGGAHLRGLAHGQRSSEETSQRWRVVGDTVTDLTDLGVVPQDLPHR